MKECRRYGPLVLVYKEKGKNEIAGHKTESVDHFRHKKGKIQ